MVRNWFFALFSERSSTKWGKMIRVQRCTVNDFTFPIVVNEPRSLFFRLYYSILNKPGFASFFSGKKASKMDLPVKFPETLRTLMTCMVLMINITKCPQSKKVTKAPTEYCQICTYILGNLKWHFVMLNIYSIILIPWSRGVSKMAPSVELSFSDNNGLFQITF